MARKKIEFQSEAARKLYESTIDAFELDEHHVQTLRLACDCLDRIAVAQAVLARDGDIIKDRYGCPKSHPAMKTLEQNKIVFARLLRELKLDENPADSEM